MAGRGRWRGAGLVGDVALAAWLLGGIVAVGVVGPERVTGRLTQMLGAVPSALASPPAGSGANAAAAPAAASPGPARAGPAHPVAAAELAATLECLAAMPPRIPGYGGGEEAAVEIRDRFVPFIERVVRHGAAAERSIILVGHGGLYTAMLPVIFKNVDFDFARQHGFPNTAYAMAETRPDGLYCTLWCGVSFE